MKKTLGQRLDDAKLVLDGVSAALGRAAGAVPPDIDAQFRGSVDARADIAHWKELISARKVAWDLLDGLENRVDGDGAVSFGPNRARYTHVRLIGVQAYLSTTWALADRITSMVGRLLCTPDGGSNPESPAQLVSHFVQKDRKRTTVGVAFDSIRQTFGWPIGISYALRNHFVHDGGQAAGADFFDGPAAFRISQDGWKRIDARASSRYGLERTFHRLGLGWPTTPLDDLRVVLADCEREVDDALGVLLGSACRSLAFHVGFILGEDA